ncbi:GNAT family N-acetyltransferase [Aliikangiella sp. IMCC44359]|uniref:GNAT family N-acetyltransferase n=1 Tax=Aliikangiella sp. IMCC44359 TaxID=3459125 RepID=UPI00403A8FD5
MITSIETERLNLVPLVPSDRYLYYHLYQDRYLTRHIGGMLSYKAVQKAFELSLEYNKQTFSRYTWTIQSKEQNIKQGICALVSGKSNNADIGTILCQESHGQGLATESLKALMKYGFDCIRLEEICGFSLLQNIQSKKLMTSLGFLCKTGIESQEEGYYWSMSDMMWGKNYSKNSI